MAKKLLDKLTDTVKKTAEAIKNVGNEEKTTNSVPSNETNDGSWIGSQTPKYSFASEKSTDYGSYKDDLERLSKAQQKAQVAQLKQARDKALANLNTQEQSIKPTYQNARNMASATSQSGARSFAEYLANRGLTNSGASAQGEINRLSSLQNTLGGLDTEEANAYRDIANKRTAIENDYVAGVANANNAIAQQYYNNLLNYNQQQRAYDDSLRQQALIQYSDNYQARINELLAQGYSPNSREILQLEALRANKINDFNNGTYRNNALAQIMAGNIDYNTARYAGFNNVAQAQTYYNNMMAQAQAQAQAEAEQLAWEREMENKKYNLDYQNTMSLINSRKNNGSNTNEAEGIVPSKSAHKNVINSNFAIDDGYGNITGYDKNAILEYVRTENSANRMLNKDAIDLLYEYGLKEEADALIGG